MIQDIMPSRLDNAFKPREAGKEHVCFTFHKGHILTGQSKTGSITLPTFEQLPGDFGKLKKKAVYAFSVDDNPMFLLPEQDLEGALRREVMEEVGLQVTDLRYYGSQPWGVSDSVISGFFAKLDGSGAVRLDRDELSEAVWLSREEIPPQNTGISITAEMIEAFRTGKVKD